MIDEKKLIEELECIKSKLKKNVYDWYPVDFADVISYIKRFPKVGEWIPCSERLPEDGRMVLVTFKKFDGHELKVGKDRYVQYPCHDSFHWQ